MKITLWRRSKTEEKPPADMELVKGSYTLRMLLIVPKLFNRSARDIGSYLSKLTKVYTIFGKVVDVKEFNVLPADLSKIPFVKRSILPSDYFEVQVEVEIVTNPLPVIIAIGAIVAIVGVFGLASLLSIERTVRFAPTLNILPVAVVLIFLIIFVGPAIFKPKAATA